MAKIADSQIAQDAAEKRVEHFQKGLGPFVVAAEHTRMPMIFTDAQIEGHPVVFANESFLSLTGFSHSEILGKDIASLLDEATGPRTRGDIEDALDRGADGTWEAECRRADGSEYLATVLMSPVLDDKGIARQNFLCFVEVSSRGDRLKAQRNEFNALYEHAPGFIAALQGQEHHFTFANASYERLVGRKNLVGHKVVDVLPEVAGQGFIQILDGVFKSGEPYVGNRVPIQIRSEDGAPCVTKHVNFVYQPVRDGDGSITGLFVEGYDVTAEVMASEQLSLLQGKAAHASRVNAMGMMAATLAHELSQPLTAISNYAWASARRLVDLDSAHAGPLAEELQAIKEAARRAGDIIRNVKELTKRGETPKTRFNLKSAVEECVKLVGAGGCPTATLDDRTPDNLTVVADRLQIQQVVINLLRNACEATDPAAGGRVTLDATLREKNVIVSVTDEGSGLSVSSQEGVFEWVASSKQGGTGLGLSLCRTMVEAQKGTIWLEKSDPSGSQFCFSVPAADSETEAAN